MPKASVLRFRTWERDVRQEREQLLFQRRPQGMLIIACCTLLASSMLWGVSRLADAFGENGSSVVARGVAFLLSMLAALGFLAALVIRVLPKLRTSHRFDFNSKTLFMRGGPVPFAQLGELVLGFLPGNSVAISVPTPRGPLILLSALRSREAELEGLRQALQAQIAGTSLPSAPQAAVTQAAVDPRFVPIVTMGIGALWGLGGFFFFSNVVFVSSTGGGRGLNLPAWWLGPAIFSVGVVQALRVRTPRTK